MMADQRAKAVTQLLNEQLAELRPHLLTLIEGLGVPEETLGAAMLQAILHHVETFA